jgi:putative DNA primase/helicase
MSQKLKAEAPGILAWLVRGALAWQRDGLEVPECVRLSTEEYQKEQDVVGGFLAECCDLNPKFHEPVWKLWNAFEAYRQEVSTSDLEVTQTAFGRYLSRHGFKSEKIKRGRWAGYIGRLGLQLKRGHWTTVGEASRSQG